MISFQLEPFLQNLSFSILFLTLLFFWIQASFFLDFTKSLDNESNSINVSSAVKDVAFQEDEQLFPKIKFSSFGTIGIFIANLTLGLLLTLRWITNGYFPLSNLYESLMFLSWSFTTLHLILEKVVLVSSQTKDKNYLIGVITAPMALFTNAFASFSLPIEMQKANSLVPALQSNWLMMHVTVMMLSYATLLIGCVLSIAFLVLSYFQSKLLLNKEPSPSAAIANPKGSFSTNLVMPLLLEKPSATYLLENEQKLEFFNTYYSNLTQNIDNLSYRILGVGFPLLTIGILSGAVWANEAWGSYWSWDPKETWALITWLIFASYFHVRITKGWKGKKPALLASVGFLIIWVCYLGVNLLGKGLHSYGWISSN
uniref:Cytochrome c biogenesis protein CcsA n=1 Tax=Microthamnion kuetzingianum TaxID=34148 RepID=A0A097KNB9_9CHLO|nr:heme attachment to plastid cytochrome c [Microthamnion kuetzingianum]AIT94668.1 heme attachment to plastid cytochrome c [Microthamnion kuetzingianum]